MTLDVLDGIGLEYERRAAGVDYTRLQRHSGAGRCDVTHGAPARPLPIHLRPRDSPLPPPISPTKNNRDSLAAMTFASIAIQTAPRRLANIASVAPIRTGRLNTWKGDCRGESLPEAC